MKAVRAARLQKGATPTTTTRGGRTLPPSDLWVGNNLHGFQIKFHVSKKEGNAHEKTPWFGDMFSARSVSGCKKATKINIANIYNMPTNQIGMTK